MNIYTRKDKVIQNKTSTNVFSKKSGDNAAFQFLDKRPEAIAQRKLKAMAEGQEKHLKNNSSTIQRLGPNLAASSPGLVAEYNNLLNSGEFQKLNTKVTTNQNITLIDSSLIPGQPVSYFAATHTIRVPLNTAAGIARPLQDVRDDILWEMHNASIRGTLSRTESKFFVPAPGPGASTEEKKKYPYQQAAYALSKEWEEWVNVVEHDLKTQQINADPAMGIALGVGPHVTRSFAALFAVADAGWYLFVNYLNAQIAGGHTTGYDANAGNPNWKGKRILNIVKSKSMAYLKVTQKQVNDYLIGKTRTVKKISNNPFKSESVITEARRGE